MKTKILLTTSQKKAVFKIKQGKNIFLQGFAGTGKTFLLKNLSKILEKNVELTATTGIAAINLGGFTISSNFSLKLGKYDRSLKELKDLNNIKWDKDTIVVIDEITMLSEEQFKQIDYALRCRGCRNKPFGGFQVIISGDFKQMPHIGWGKSLKESDLIKNFEKIELTENVRQKDDDNFFEILKEVRDIGFSDKTISFIKENQKKHKEDGRTQIVATRSLMDELNENLVCPKDKEIIIFKCNMKDTERAYDVIKIWEGMPIIVTKNNIKSGYCNGDTGFIVGFCKETDTLCVKLDRNEQKVTITMADASFDFWEEKEIYITEIKDKTVEYREFSKEKNCFQQETKKTEESNIEKKYLEEKEIYITKILSKFSYEYMPILPASYLSIRRCQGLTLKNGILHESIANAHLYNSKDKINIQYVALSRFESISQVHVLGL